MAKVRVGLIGCGFVAELHMYAYKRVYGVDVEVAAVAARGDHVIEFAKKHRIPATYRDFRAVLADKTIDVVDIGHLRDDRTVTDGCERAPVTRCDADHSMVG